MMEITFTCPNRIYRVQGTMEFEKRGKKCSICHEVTHNAKRCGREWTGRVLSVITTAVRPSIPKAKVKIEFRAVVEFTHYKTKRQIYGMIGFEPRDLIIKNAKEFPPLSNLVKPGDVWSWDHNGIDISVSDRDDITLAGFQSGYDLSFYYGLYEFGVSDSLAGLRIE